MSSAAAINRGTKIREIISGLRGMVVDIINLGLPDERYSCKLWNPQTRDYAYQHLYRFEFELSIDTKQVGFKKNVEDTGSDTEDV